MFASRREASLKKASLSQSPPSGRGGGGVARQFRLAEEAFGRLVGRVEFTAHVQSNPSPVMRLHALGDVCALGHESGFAQWPPSSLRRRNLSTRPSPGRSWSAISA